MKHNAFALLLIAVVAVLAAFTVLKINSVSGQAIIDNSVNPGMSWRTSTSILDYGLPSKPVPLVGYQRQISTGRCQVQGTCRGVANPTCAAVPLYVNGFLKACVRNSDATGYPLCSHKSVGGYFGNDACSPIHPDWRIRNDCVCV